jgi:antitoxin (DNA-binding transcriptional repressor) of toxin-antitoxin stability system
MRWFMFEQVDFYDAKTQMPDILQRVEAGESFTITNRGKAIADLIPSRTKTQQKTLLAIESILKIKKTMMSDKQLAELKLQEQKRK